VAGEGARERVDRQRVTVDDVERALVAGDLAGLADERGDAVAAGQGQVDRMSTDVPGCPEHEQSHHHEWKTGQRAGT
jgi:hypothetical protein